MFPMSSKNTSQITSRTELFPIRQTVLEVNLQQEALKVLNLAHLAIQNSNVSVFKPYY